MKPPPVDVAALLDPERCEGPATAAPPDGIWEASRGVFARSARVYSETPFDHAASAEDPDGFERRLTPLARRLGDLLPHSGAVLEAGSGPGHMTAWLRGRGVPVVALDQSRESLRRLRARTDAPAVVADVARLPFKDEAFDAVIADGVIHHATKPAAALRDLVRVLKPGGLLFVRVYRAESGYPALYRTVGGVLRLLDGASPRSAIVWRGAFPAYRWAADRRYAKRGEEPGRHDEGVFADYFLTPRATPIRGASLLAALKRQGLEVVAYEGYRNVHGFLARRTDSPGAAAPA